MKHLIKAGLILFFLLLSINQVVAENYAPVISAEGVDNFLKLKINRANEALPELVNVPVKAPTGFSLAEVRRISSTSTSEYQDNRVLILVSERMIGDVLPELKKQLSGWDITERKYDTLFLKSGNQQFWGGNKMLEAPRVIIRDISTPFDESEETMRVLGMDGMMIKKELPSLKSLLTINYEVSREPLLDIDVDTVMANCVSTELKRMMEMEKQRFTPEMGKQVAASNCNRTVQKGCAKDTKARNCQRYARLYLNP